MIKVRINRADGQIRPSGVLCEMTGYVDGLEFFNRLQAGRDYYLVEEKPNSALELLKGCAQSAANGSETALNALPYLADLALKGNSR